MIRAAATSASPVPVRPGQIWADDLFLFRPPHLVMVVSRPPGWDAMRHGRDAWCIMLVASSMALPAGAMWTVILGDASDGRWRLVSDVP